MGAATALYSATCCAHGKYGNGSTYPLSLSAIVGLSGWLPCAKYVILLLLRSNSSVRLSLFYFAFKVNPTAFLFLCL